MKKKVLSTLLALVMIFSLLPTAAFAAGGAAGRAEEPTTAPKIASVGFNASADVANAAITADMKAIGKADANITDCDVNTMWATVSGLDNTKTYRLEFTIGSGSDKLVYPPANKADGEKITSKTIAGTYFTFEQDNAGSPSDKEIAVGEYTVSLYEGEVATPVDTATITLAKDASNVYYDTTDAAKVVGGDPSSTVYYDTLVAAVAAAQSNDTVTLLDDATGAGIKILANRKLNKITIDLGGNTYTCDGRAVGSPNTESQGFHFEKDNTIILQNGTIAVQAGVENPKTLIQNYANLTLKDIKLDGTNVNEGNFSKNNQPYVDFPITATFTLNSYCGTVSLENTEIINSTRSDTAYGIGCGWESNYTAGTHITVNEASKFENVFIYRDKAEMTTTGGTPSSIKIGSGEAVSKTFVANEGPSFFEYLHEVNTLVAPKDVTVKVTGIATDATSGTTVTPKIKVTFGTKNKEVSANTDGKYTLAAGRTYGYTVTAEGYETKTGTFEVKSNTSEVEVAMKALSNTYAADFTVTTGSDKDAKAVVGAKVEVKETVAPLAEEALPTTDAYGKCTVSNLSKDVTSYTYTVKADGYEDATGTILAKDMKDGKVAVPVTMTAEKRDVTFAVTPDTATVEVKDSAGKVVTPKANGGKVYELNKPDAYSYTITANDYITQTGIVKSDDVTITKTLTPVNHDYTVTFNVTGLPNGVTPTIEVKQDTTTVEAQDGKYTLNNTKAYTYTVKATGYNDVSGSIGKKDDTNAQTIAVSMVKTDNTYTATFTLNTADSDADITVMDEDGGIVSATTSANAPTYTLDKAQTYTYTVTKSVTGSDGLITEYTPVSGTIPAPTGDATTVEVAVAKLTAVNYNYELTFNVTGLASDVTATIKVDSQAITGSKTTLDSRKSYTYEVTATGYNDVTGTIAAKGAAAAATINVTMVEAAIIPSTEPKVEIGDMTGVDAAIVDSIVIAAKNTTVPTETANEIAVAASNEKDAIETKLATDITAAEEALGGETKTFVQTYLEIAVNGYTEDEDTGIKTLKLDITPKATVVVAKNAANDADAITVGTETLTVTKPVTVTLTLPAGFAQTGAMVYVNHKGITYRTQVQADNTISFVTKGFSPFEISTKAAADIKAYIKETGAGYASLTDALKAVENGQTIQVVATDEGTLNSNSAVFKIELENGATATIKDGYGNVVTPENGVYTFTSANYKGGTSGGGGGGGSTLYTLTFETNGGTAISKVSKAKGTVITLSDYKTTREGYTFDGWYSDKDLTKKVTSVTLNASTTVYAKWIEGSNVSTIPFKDVATGDWFYEAVKYAYDNSLMNGTATTSFSPNQTTTRAMIVTMLYRLEKEPAVTGASSFTDLEAGQYYLNAVNWAAANKIVTGTTTTTFSPNGTVTREQLATILYRFAQYKGYNVSATGSLAGFPDAGTVSEYATSAMQWAVGAKIINGTDGQLQPTGGATRAQVATMFMRFCENIAK